MKSCEDENYFEFDSGEGEFSRDCAVAADFM